MREEGGSKDGEEARKRERKREKGRESEKGEREWDRKERESVRVRMSEWVCVFERERETETDDGERGCDRSAAGSASNRITITLWGFSLSQNLCVRAC